MTKPAVFLATALMTAVIGLVALAPPASAWEGTSGKFNMWQHDGYEGHSLSRYSYDTDLHNDSCSDCDPGWGGNFGDDMSSFVNKTRYWWVIYVAARYGDGTKFCVRPRSHDGDLGNNGFSNLEDEISSVKRTNRTGSDPGIIACHRIGHAN